MAEGYRFITCFQTKLWHYTKEIEVSTFLSSQAFISGDFALMILFTFPFFCPNFFSYCKFLLLKGDLVLIWICKVYKNTR